MMLAACEGQTLEESADSLSPAGPEPLPASQVAACPRPPAGTDPQAEKAYERVNAYRRAMGLPCLTPVAQIAAAATAHCGYYTANRGSCVANPHREVASCKGFTAERFADRMRAAGYAGHPAYEVMTYVGSGAHAVDKWIDSVWHRIPLLSPWVADAGYGGGRACDTMNFGWAPSTTAPPRAPVVYPYDGQVKVPRSFDGRLESPVLPAPPRGWPSGYPIIVYASELTVHRHLLLDERMAEVPHTWLTPADPATHGVLRNELLMYAHAPLESGKRYQVIVDGERLGAPLRLAWTFTTR